MSKLIKTMDEQFSPLIAQVKELSTQIADVCATKAVKQIQINNALQVSIASRDYRVQQAITLNTLEEGLQQLWTMQLPTESKAEFISKVHVLNHNLQDSSNGSANTGVDPKYKLSFKQVFDPKTSTIAAFFTIYKTDMHQAPVKLKKKHILTCLHPTCQEMVVSKLGKIITWAQMKEMLIEEFGGDLSLEVKSDSFMHTSFKPNETLAEFANYFYLEGQQLITSCLSGTHFEGNKPPSW
ncbi:hypothetical protein DSO57_1002506 [Entomophthora muscae]|uniref:Uncharacterized protein n=1 Tax=Entomophthora muscae TaxID=34485 RepID=A0ACC2SLN5_9FUNG|nr:hypothetical protein DSO57_1002506 [Entomophthora muscae]